MIRDRITEDLKDAMRAKDAVRLRTLRSLRAALQEREIETRTGGEAGELNEDDELAVLDKQAKQRREAIDQYERADREDLVEKERAELEVIEEYLPRPLSDDEIRGVIHEVITATGAQSPQAFGKVMGAVMQRVRGRADGQQVQVLVREILSDVESS